MQSSSKCGRGAPKIFEPLTPKPKTARCRLYFKIRVQSPSNKSRSVAGPLHLCMQSHAGVGMLFNLPKIPLGSVRYAEASLSLLAQLVCVLTNQLANPKGSSASMQCDLASGIHLSSYMKLTCLHTYVCRTSIRTYLL